MANHLKRTEKNEVYFITFTCYKWLPLIDKSNTYNYIYQWFSYLKMHNCDVLAYVVMPNHFHGIFHIQEKCEFNLNTLIGNGKRFWAYQIVKQLADLKEQSLLAYLSKEVSVEEANKGYHHRVFEYSFDSKICYNRKILETKLDYIHLNPVSGKWKLSNDFTSYLYSSASFYELDEPNEFISHYRKFV